MERGVAAPRVGYVPFPYNFPMGQPENRRMHREVAMAALGLLDDLQEPAEVGLPFAPW